MIELTTQEIMELIQLCSKACLIHPHKIMFDKQMEGTQFSAAQQVVIPILGRLDKQYPGLMPVPHDGVTWQERAAKPEDK